MNYSLELNIQQIGSNIIFSTIFFDYFKVNIVERYTLKENSKQKLAEVLFKVRTNGNRIIKKKDGYVNTYIRGDSFKGYIDLKTVLSSYKYKRKLIDKHEAEQDFVNFILSFVVANYELG